MLYRLIAILIALLSAAPRLAHAGRAAAPDVIDSLVAHGSERGQFLAIILHESKSDGSLQPVSTVHLRPPGGGSDAWVRFAQFDARVLALAEWSGELAVLLETAQSGTDRTQLRFIHNDVEAGRSNPTDIRVPLPPERFAILDIAGGSAAAPLILLATGPQGAAVWSLAGTQWRQLPALPEQIAALEKTNLDMGSTSGRPTLAARTSERQVDVFLLADDGWQSLGAIQVEPDEQFMIVSGQEVPSPTLYVFGAADRLVRLATSAADGGAATMSHDIDFASARGVRARFAAEDPRASAVALGSLRLVRAAFTEGREGNQALIEMALDPASLEPVGDGSAVLLSFPALTPQELRDQIMMLALYGLLVVAVIAVLRQRPVPPADRLREVTQRLAPFSLRAGAGTIDAIPLALAAGAWWLTRDAADPTQEWLIGVAGVVIYLAHTTASEVVTGRTLGKLLFRLRVVKTDGTPAGPGAILLRNLLRPLDAPTAGLGMALLNPLRQRIGDIAAGTTVIQLSSGPRQP